ncbi:hypothetical protein Dsin_000528 [Dipteronia sinensis]|uniref:Reverse transcriptase domain-containing protein n=1 Tax=Dipteronia sinensis TaxID=43782 RepID=A0AAE0B2I3_9ROSI|nr:hypothetical protein Dsin_000528 [Dipteronia sinensis]
MLSSWNIRKRRDHRHDLQSKKDALKKASQANLPIEGDIGKIVDGVSPRLDSITSRFLDANFTGEEVRLAVFAMNPIKAPGSDGLPAIFYQHYWELVGSSIVEACMNILNHGATVEGMNNTVICLIPKNQKLETMADFRPISLCNVIYKIIAKVITNRFRHALGGIISENQCAFIPGHLISDNTIVGFECIHRLKRRERKKGSMAIKLDMSKAFDRVEWHFLARMMEKLGFSSKWVGLIMRCISSVSYSVMINGELCGHISPTRGLRQGDPLSPLLFLICAEGGVLADYGRASGQVINFDKSAMCISPSFSVSAGQNLSSRVGIKLVECHESYLGLPCIVGKEILVKVVVQAPPSYAMSMFRLPKSLINEIHRLCDRFWWGGNEKKRKIHWCSWKHLCKEKCDGGLGFHNPETSNRAFLAKQCWRLLNNPNSLAGRVLKSCYYKVGSILEATKKSNDSYVWNSLIWGKGLLDTGVRCRVGDGKSITIWKDKWIPRPTTFKLTSPPKIDGNATVDQLISSSGGWNTHLIRDCYMDSYFGLIISEILNLKDKMGAVSFSCTSKTSNKVANNLALYALRSHKDTYWMEDYPLCLANIVEADKPD